MIYLETLTNKEKGKRGLLASMKERSLLLTKNENISSLRGIASGNNRTAKAGP